MMEHSNTGARLAACEWIFAGRPLDEVLRRLQAAGCDGIELSGEPGRADRAALPDTLAGAGMRASGITAVCPWPTTDRDLAHPDAGARRSAVEYYRRCVDLAVESGAPAIGLIPAAIGRLAPVRALADEWADAVAGARAVAEYAGERGVKVGVEAVNRYESFLVTTAEAGLAFRADVGLENVGLVLDTYHMHIEEADSAAAVRDAAPHLVALHLADSNRRGIGRGQADVTGLVRAARAGGFSGPLVFEFTAPGPDPFRALQSAEAMAMLDVYAKESVAAVQSEAEMAVA